MDLERARKTEAILEVKQRDGTFYVFLAVGRVFI